MLLEEGSDPGGGRFRSLFDNRNVPVLVNREAFFEVARGGRGMGAVLTLSLIHI